MTMTVLRGARPDQVSDLVKREDPEMSRERFTLLAGSGGVRTVLLGTPLGKLLAAGVITAAQAAVGGNTGNGTLALANPAFAAGAKIGVYTVTCTTGGADGTSKFRVEDPEGVAIGTATGGSAFSKAVKFTISGGGTNFVEGDTFNVTLSQAVGVNDGKVAIWDPTATDGRQKLWGFSLRTVAAADGVDNDTDGLAIRRLGVLRLGAILWPEGTTDAQKAAAILDADERLKLLIRT
ncbi:head decoration protein [Pararhizobium sp. O133]|uniref:head decoration protein n=1 Tax=Pararhizobium sp. O133 TaxID=3449278 RepID=UPI003F682BA8